MACIMCCFPSWRHWQCVWVMSMTQHKRCVANLALHWERQSHFNQIYWGGVCLERQAKGFKDLTNKTCQRELGCSQNWYADLLTIYFPYLGHRWPFNNAGYSLMQTNNVEHLKAANGVHGSSFFSSLSLCSPKIIHPFLTVLKVGNFKKEKCSKSTFLFLNKTCETAVCFN